MQPVLHVHAFEDNYIWLIRGNSRSHAAIVDPGDAEPVLRELTNLGLTPAAILLTHHHGDHTGGVAGLLQRFPATPVYGPALEAIEGITHPLDDGDIVLLPSLELKFSVLHVPGHTRGHVAYCGHGWLFCGDTLFSAGCGRLFEGTAEQMYQSLCRLAALPTDTLVYCAHEYTLPNLRFAQTVEPENADIPDYRNEVESLRARKIPSVPSTLARELAVNPFLRSHVSTVRDSAERRAGKPLADDTSVFREVRRWKDGFRG
ncbi:MAG: hydroxyacylglutathione hydrolase [Gammaproteobacteria bacterium]|nr:hydroxyacylglutathione hydrolase [Gammaproteobacteria bacterium]